MLVEKHAPLDMLKVEHYYRTVIAGTTLEPQQQ